MAGEDEWDNKTRGGRKHTLTVFPAPISSPKSAHQPPRSVLRLLPLSTSQTVAVQLTVRPMAAVEEEFGLSAVGIEVQSKPPSSAAEPANGPVFHIVGNRLMFSIPKSSSQLTQIQQEQLLTSKPTRPRSLPTSPQSLQRVLPGLAGAWLWPNIVPRGQELLLDCVVCAQSCSWAWCKDVDVDGMKTNNNNNNNNEAVTPLSHNTHQTSSSLSPASREYGGRSTGII